jgi:hypothetical protein
MAIATRTRTACHDGGMCAGCVMGAMTAGASATGARSWLATRNWVWLTPARLHRLTVGLLVVALALTATVLGGSS